MNEDVNTALKTVAKGSAAVFGGTAIGMVLALSWRLLAINSMSAHDFGVFFLALSITNLLAGVSGLGLPDGIPRYISYFRGRGEDRKISAVVSAGIKIAVAFSLVIVFIMVIAAPMIASYMSLDDLTITLWIMLAGIPFFSVSVIITSIFRAYNNVRVKVYFIEIFKRLFILMGLALLMVLNSADLITVSTAFSLSGISVFLLVLIYYLRYRPEFQKIRDRELEKEVRKDLMFFSLPLLGMGFMDTIFMAIPPTLLGILATAEDIASFGAGITISTLVGVAMTSLNFLYLPMMSDFFARNMKKEMRRIYSLVSKWAFFSMAIVIMGFILLSDVIVKVLFGAAYSQTGLVMALQAIGFFSIYLFGPVRATLIVVGKPRFLLISSAAGLLVSVALSIIFIPYHGAMGAALSVAAGLLVMYGLNAAELQMKEGLNPFTHSYSKTFLGGLLVMLLSAIVRARTDSLPYLLLSLISLSLIYLGYLFAVKAVEDEDVELLQSLLKKVRRGGNDPA